MGKPIFIILSPLLVVAGLVGIVFEVYKMSQDSILRFAKHDIVGDYDALYDEYFPRHYHATGILSLPFDSIVEPFEVWFAGDRNMSRIDYYYGKYAYILKIIKRITRLEHHLFMFILLNYDCYQSMKK